MRVAPPSVTLTFQGKRDWPLTPEIDDWGLTPSQQETYVEQFRRILDAKKAWREDVHDYFYLRRFMRARSYDLEKATAMWLNHVAWLAEFSVETILTDFYFTERDEFLEAYPQGYHKLDKVGRPIYIQLLGKIDMARIKKSCTEDRMLKFHIQEYERCRKVILPVCSRLAGRHIDQTFGIMDVKGVGLGHLSGEVKRLMTLVTKYDQDNYPEMLGHICIVNAPSVFRMLWGFAKGLIDPRTQNKIEILGTNYMPELLKWVDIENIPKWLGGESDGTLIDDLGPWSDSELCARIGVDVEAMRSGAVLPPLPQQGQAFARGSRRFGSGRDTAGTVTVVPSFIRLASGNESDFASPLNSAASLGSFRTSAGVPETVVEEAAKRYARSVSSRASGESQRLEGASGNGLNPGTEPAKGGSGAGVRRAGARSLVDRVAAIEKMLPEQMERVKRDLPMTANGAINANVSTASAPEGSLLNRVEILEEAMDMLLDAQQATLEVQQKVLLNAEQQARAEQAGGCGCAVM
ncbi:hypothetical protein FOA52_012591 [Chlamydomonas sp. UWO 241]|nr:hypothetical protein FOA52_012591 [Chlamydomonas sp. UWO 241]